MNGKWQDYSGNLEYHVGDRVVGAVDKLAGYYRARVATDGDELMLKFTKVAAAKYWVEMVANPQPQSSPEPVASQRAD